MIRSFQVKEQRRVSFMLSLYIETRYSGARP
jgi:hypothetical protein